MKRPGLVCPPFSYEIVEEIRRVGPMQAPKRMAGKAWQVQTREAGLESQKPTDYVSTQRKQKELEARLDYKTSKLTPVTHFAHQVSIS